MAWEDRRSYRDPIRPAGRYWAVLNGTLPLMPVRGIRVQVHSTFLFSAALILGIGPGRHYPWQSRVECVGALLVAAVCHELAHLRGRRWAGEAGSDQIVLTPVGGMPAIASRWRLPSIAGLLAGPSASFLLCAVCLAGLHFSHPGEWNPAHLGLHTFRQWSELSFHLSWLYSVSFLLLVINLLPIFPLDFGQVLHALLARHRGFEASVRFICASSIVGALILAVVGVVMQNWLVVISGLTCLFFAVGLFVRWTWEVSGTVELAEGLDDPYMSGMAAAEPRPVRSRRRLSRWTVRRLRRMARQEELDQLHVDKILAKVSKHGIKSLTWGERRALYRATSRQRFGDAEEKG
jgi:Zn-dependent protease